MNAVSAVNRRQKRHNTLFTFNRFELRDKLPLEKYLGQFKLQSCEYNFANLFAWQDIYKLSWSIYQGRLLIHDGLQKISYMPLGEDFYPEDLVILSLNLKKEGFSPNFGLVPQEYIERYPSLSEYYTIERLRDAAEYIYDVDQLFELSGNRLHKKKNLVSQFEKYYPDYKVHEMTEEYRERSLEFCRNLLDKYRNAPEGLNQEFEAITNSFAYFDRLDLEGIAITVKGRMAAMSVFSRINLSTYDIQFEKFDTVFKGAGQMINFQTAKYLRDKCRYLNREQDLGIKGLRQAKQSYDPVELLMPYGLTHNPPN